MRMCGNNFFWYISDLNCPLFSVNENVIIISQRQVHFLMFKKRLRAEHILQPELDLHTQSGFTHPAGLFGQLTPLPGAWEVGVGKSRRLRDPFHLAFPLLSSPFPNVSTA